MPKPMMTCPVCMHVLFQSCDAPDKLQCLGGCGYAEPIDYPVWDASTPTLEPCLRERATAPYRQSKLIRPSKGGAV